METSQTVEITDEELNEFMEERENANTEKLKSAYDVELYKRFTQTSNPGLDSISLHGSS